MIRRDVEAVLTTMAATAALIGAPVADAQAPSSEAAGVTNGPIAYTKSWRVLHTPGPDERSDIFKVSPNGDGNKRLTFFRDAREPLFAPVGGRIAFERPGEVWVMDGDGSDQRRLTDGRLVDWLPTGDRVLVVRGLGADGVDPTWALHDLATGEEQEIAIDLPLVPDLDTTYRDYDYPDHSEWSWAGNPVLSPDGETLALMLYRRDWGDDQYDWDFASVYTVGLDGAGLTRVPKYTYAWGISGWSPNGQQLLYWAEEPRAECASSVRSLRPDGTAGGVHIPRRCAQPGPVWSPDGRRILFVSGRSDSLQIASKDGKRNRTVLAQVAGVSRSDPDWRAGH